MTRLAAMAVLLTSVSWASDSYKPPEGGNAWQMGRIYLKPAATHKQASGTVVFPCNAAETQHRCQLYAKNVPANGLYTLWLVDMDGTKVRRTYEVTGSRWRALKSDARGVLAFVGNLPWCPAARDVFVVKHHPDPRKRRFAEGVTVLKGYLKTME